MHIICHDHKFLEAFHEKSNMVIHNNIDDYHSIYYKMLTFIIQRRETIIRFSVNG